MFPARTCVGCHRKFPQKDLLRITRLTSEKKIILNLKQENLGRSVYLCSKKECVKKALYRKGADAISHILKIKPTAEFLKEIEELD